MTRIAIIEPEPLFISLSGGSGVVLTGIIKVLKKRGYNITLYSPLANKKDKMNFIDNIDNIGNIYVYRTLFNLSQFQIFSIIRLYCIYSAILSSKIFSYDFTICSSYDQLIGNFDFGYIHFPSRKYFKFSDIKKVKNIRNLLDYISSFYFRPSTKILAANSSYTAEYTSLLVGKKPYVLYPPVTPIICQTENMYRENIVVSLGRIARDKNYEYVIEASKRFPNIKFIIIGRVVDQKYYQELILNKPENLIIITNASEETKKEILCKAKVLLHPKFNEHFGISIVEGMSSGLIPVVYKGGGAWDDITEKGKYGFGFLNLRELLDVLPVALNEEKLRKDIIDKANEFNFNWFEEKFLKITGL